MINLLLLSSNGDVEVENRINDIETNDIYEACSISFKTILQIF